jgi:outer membrane protein TolC
MIRAASLRALALSGLAFGLSAVSVGAEQTSPAQTPPDPANTPLAPSAIKASRAQITQPPTQTTPAEKQYGLPRNPMTGAPVDVDLTKPLMLDRAIAIGLAMQNSIAIARTQVDTANARLVQARSSFYPQVTPTLQYQATTGPGARSLNGTTAFGSTNSESRTDLISAHQLIFDTGKREATASQTRRTTFAAQYGLGNERQNVVLLVTQDYFNLLRDRELVRVEQENVVRATTTRDVIKAQVEVGTAAQSDNLQAEADLANANVAVLQSQSDFDVAQASLKNSMGIISSKPLVLSADTATEPSSTPDTTGIDPYVRLAFANRLDIKQQQENVYVQGYAVRIAKINSGLTVQATLDEGYALDPHAGEERDFLVSFSYPLFDAGATRAVVHENQAGLEQARRTLDQLEQNVHLAVEQSYRIREQARQRLAAAKLAVQASQLNYDVQLEKQRNQLVNIPEVVTAELQLITAQVSYINAIYDFYIADASLKRQIGVNDAVYVPGVPGNQPPIMTPTTP